MWPDLHTAPGTQNGFDNSGHKSLTGPICTNWCDNKDNVQRTVNIVTQIVKAIQELVNTDVVTGFGPLNEAFTTCSLDIIRQFYNETFFIVKQYLGPEVNVYIGDAFQVNTFNDGWWLDPVIYNNIYLESHYYQGKYLTKCFCFLYTVCKLPFGDTHLYHSQHLHDLVLYVNHTFLFLHTRT